MTSIIPHKLNSQLFLPILMTVLALLMALSVSQHKLPRISSSENLINKSLVMPASKVMMNQHQGYVLLVQFKEHSMQILM